MNVIRKYISLAIIGILSGGIAGIFGTSTAYALFLGLMVTEAVGNYKHILGTILFTILPPLSIGAVYVYAERKQVDFRAGLFLMPILAISAYVGAKFQGIMTIQQGEVSMGIFLFIISMSLFYKAYYGKGNIHTRS